MVRKIVRQYNAEPISDEDMEKLLTVAQEYRKVKNHIYQRYSGIKSLAKVYQGYTIQQELLHDDFRKTVNLPTIYVVLAINEALGNIKAQWTAVRQQVQRNVSQHPDFADEAKHYLRYVLKMPQHLAAILNRKAVELPEIFNRDKRVLDNYLCRQVRKAMPAKLAAKERFSFSVPPKSGYRYKNQGIYISTAIPRKRVFIPLTDKNIYDREIKILLKPQVAGVEIKIPVEVKTKPTTSTKTIGVTIGWHSMLVTDQGHEYGRDFGKYQQKLVVLTRHQRHITNQPGNTPGQKKYLMRRHRLEEQLHSYINHAINLMLDTEEPGIICIPKMPAAQSRDGNKYRNHSLNLWQRGYIRRRLKLKCELRGIEVQEIYGKPTFPDKC
ncbi:hypothetical protein SAMN05216582_1223 [Selenomonas ruminantium]|uniref:Transposase n=1 Tax=Selenomonas ruminantium TaxID=971 RepID=A0A1M6W1W8_SELRU|nr:hypothetical protein [Selenomonas ruminantium]SHK87667.1 hypothetical protein SAMN05216582_1223 [Selenomonas ruminantium]